MVILMIFLMCRLINKPGGVAPKNLKIKAFGLYLKK